MDSDYAYTFLTTGSSRGKLMNAWEQSANYSYL